MTDVGEDITLQKVRCLQAASWLRRPRPCHGPDACCCAGLGTALSLLSTWLACVALALQVKDRLVASKIRVIAISVGGSGLNQAGTYQVGSCSIPGDASPQASTLAAASGGAYYQNVTPSQIVQVSAGQGRHVARRQLLQRLLALGL